MPSGIWFQIIGLLKLTRSCPDRLRMVPVRSSSTSSPRCKDATIPAYQRGVVISDAKWSLDHDRQSGDVTEVSVGRSAPTMSARTASPLNGLRVMVGEDDWFISQKIR